MTKPKLPTSRRRRGSIARKLIAPIILAGPLALPAGWAEAGNYYGDVDL